MQFSPKHLRNIIGIMILLLLAIYQVRQAVFQEEMPADCLIGVLSSILVVFFCVADSKLVGKRIVHGLRWVMLITWPVPVPIYFLWAHGWKGLLYTLVCGGLYLTTGVSVYYLAYWFLSCPKV